MSLSFEVSSDPNGPISVRDARRVEMARRVTAAKLRCWGLAALVDDAKLIVSELVTNAIRHSGTAEICLSVIVAHGSLRLHVQDGMPGTCKLGRPTDTAESGRGLFLVDALVSEHGGDWGTTDAGATTWCRLTVPDTAAS
ncbi:ATP-binding protein [Streptomyces sp. BSE6.1]|uniref:ATP-binding protein n=1 Tax=Streptomyces sp. BSE6.1 TaxID=2605730 RepID=UPI001F30F0FA|nr:ATP-binding protein [Streptomyces sp. BSE6.1]